MYLLVMISKLYRKMRTKLHLARVSLSLSLSGLQVYCTIYHQIRKVREDSSSYQVILSQKFATILQRAERDIIWFNLIISTTVRAERVYFQKSFLLMFQSATSRLLPSSFILIKSIPSVGSIEKLIFS